MAKAKKAKAAKAPKAKAAKALDRSAAAKLMREAKAATKEGKTNKTPRADRDPNKYGLIGDGYKGHRPASRKAAIHKIYDENGRDAALTAGRGAGLKEATLRTWMGTWARNDKGLKPTPRKPKAAKAAKAKPARKAKAKANARKAVKAAKTAAKAPKAKTAAKRRPAPAAAPAEAAAAV